MSGSIWLRARWLLAIAVGLLGLPLCVQAQEPPKSCSLRRVTELPLNESANRFTITAHINDRPVVMLVDTGAGHSAISPELVKRLHLPQDRRTSITVHGMGGDMRVAHPVIARSFRAGDGHLVNYEFEVANASVPGLTGQPGAPEGLLGLDLLSYYELEFDFPNRILTLYTQDNCNGSFIPWTGPFEVIAGRRQLDGQLFIPVSLNKEAINALIDTGATRSALGIDAAHDIGVSDDELRLDRATYSFGVPGVPVRAYEHHFDSFTVGRTTFHRASLLIPDERLGVVQMLLGMDFFRPRKLWVSFKTEQIFLQLLPAERAVHAPP